MGHHGVLSQGGSTEWSWCQYLTSVLVDQWTEWGQSCAFHSRYRGARCSSAVSCPGEWNQRRPVHVPVIGVRYNSLLWICTLNTLNWPDKLRGKSDRSWCDGSSDRSFLVDLLSYFSFKPVLHDWCNKGRGMCYTVCLMMHTKELLLLIGKSNRCGGSGFPLSLHECSSTICLTPYDGK